MSHDPTEFFFRLQESVEQSRQSTERAALRLRDRLDAMERMTGQCTLLLGQMERALDTTATPLSQEPPSPKISASRTWRRAALIAAPLFAAGLACGWMMG